MKYQTLERHSRSANEQPRIPMTANIISPDDLEKTPVTNYTPEITQWYRKKFPDWKVDTVMTANDGGSTLLSFTKGDVHKTFYAQLRIGCDHSSAYLFDPSK